jgi:hypothetical protein
MKSMVFFAAVMGVFCVGGWARAADKPDEQKIKTIEPLYQEVQQLVQRYYPKAVLSASYDPKTQAERIHFQYNTQRVWMYVARKDGSGEELKLERGPFVGGIWCDMTLEKGRYAGTMEGLEKGRTELGPDFNNYVIAPYSKKLDRRVTVILRYPGGTPPKFLKQLNALVGDFERYVEKPEK